MRIEKIGNRGVLFTMEAQDSAFAEDYYIYLINGEKNLFLCDTHVGPASMKPIQQYLVANGLDKKPLVIFQSHSDWDHIWGACAFPGATVVAQHRSLQRLFDRGYLELHRYTEYQNGEVRLVPPSITFESRMLFCEDGVELSAAPGHTEDSAICYDRRDSVLYVGDLVERPRPVIQDHDLETYVETLEEIKGIAAQVMIASHSGQVSQEDIEDNITYIREFQDIAMMEPEGTDSEETEMMRKRYTLLMYEDAIAQTVGDEFDYLIFQKELWHSLELNYLSSTSELLQQVGYEELKLALESYMVGL